MSVHRFLSAGHLDADIRAVSGGGQGDADRCDGARGDGASGTGLDDISGGDRTGGRGVLDATREDRHVVTGRRVERGDTDDLGGRGTGRSDRARATDQ
jgi:hypothetical protein